MKFLLGESMGGAVALLLHRKKPNYWDGLILVAPMCKASNNNNIIYIYTLINYVVITTYINWWNLI